MDNQEILNAQKVEDFSDIELSKEEKVFYTDCDKIVVIEKYKDLIECLDYMLVIPFRFSTCFKTKPFIYFLSKDVDIPEVEEMFGRRNLLIKWEAKTWKKIGKSIRELTGRELLIKHDWFIEFRDDFIVKGII